MRPLPAISAGADTSALSVFRSRSTCLRFASGAALLRRRVLSLVSVAESLDTGSTAGRLVINIMTAVSQWEREAIGERTRDAMQHKRANGQCVGNLAYGYRSSADGKHVEAEPSEQKAL